jgi:glutamyl-tRNA synthetase
MVTPNTQVRVRIAPSPTGDPHVGLAYITLFNYVIAKKHGGKLILRIEDTDQERSKASSEQLIMDSLHWLGLSWDEGPDIGGPYGPYKQSERKDIYRNYVDELVAKGKAYPCFCSAERLEKVRQEQRAKGLTTGYDRHCRNLDKASQELMLCQGLPHTVRLKVPLSGITTIKDELRGQIEFANEMIDDQVLCKSDGMPTYHLANVVDDHLMAITHVVRAEEWISSTPKHQLLYEAFGWQQPQFVHMPILRNEDKSKISKRKNPVSLNYYRRKGILPRAMLNFLALMGWAYSAEEELFTVDQMIEKFTLNDIHLGGPVFDLVKLTRINQHYVQQLSPENFAHYLRNEFFSMDYLQRLHPLVKERLEVFEQFVDRNGFFFNGALDYTGLSIIPKGKTEQEFGAMVADLLLILDDLYTWNEDALHQTMETHREKMAWKPRDYLMPIRLIVSGRPDSPPLHQTMAVVGREMVRFRLRDFLKKSNLGG